MHSNKRLERQSYESKVLYYCPKMSQIPQRAEACRKNQNILLVDRCRCRLSPNVLWICDLGPCCKRTVMS